MKLKALEFLEELAKSLNGNDQILAYSKYQSDLVSEAIEELGLLQKIHDYQKIIVDEFYKHGNLDELILAYKLLQKELEDIKNGGQNEFIPIYEWQWLLFGKQPDTYNHCYGLGIGYATDSEVDEEVYRWVKIEETKRIRQ